MSDRLYLAAAAACFIINVISVFVQANAIISGRADIFNWFFIVINTLFVFFPVAQIIRHYHVAMKH